MYISLWENSRGHPDNVSFMQFSKKIDGFEQKDSHGFENSYNSYEQYPLDAGGTDSSVRVTVDDIVYECLLLFFPREGCEVGL